MNKIVRNILLGLFVCLTTALPQHARADDGSKEYLIKAGFIYNFVKFVEWPGGFAVNQHPGIDICVFGDSPMISTGAIFKAASTDKLKLSLVQEKRAENIAQHCHVVFIAKSEEDNLSTVLAALKGHPVLTVSDMNDFVDHGGMIGFVTNEQKVKLEINAKAATSAGLRIDAQLLEVALKVIQE